jgi:hypothetical protein
VEQSRTGDSLFSEAEKIGIDVREDTGSGLTFNFFEEEANTEAPAAQQSSALVTAVDTSSLLPPVVEDSHDSSEEVAAATAVIPVVVTLPSLSFIFSGAFSFHRDM